mmetsp:Transcript_18619/g.55577  ORF Transcript_18619/g.55577 Transcript_18619/m.55577 type:complete len:87 (-) Transcript_18619:67-327(-)
MARARRRSWMSMELDEVDGAVDVHGAGCSYGTCMPMATHRYANSFLLRHQTGHPPWRPAGRQDTNWDTKGSTPWCFPDHQLQQVSC